jgi:hypothetical protein
MRKTFLFIMIAGAFAACNNDTKVSGAAETKSDKPAVAMPMPVTYSSSFEMGDPKYGAMIVQGSWKDWVDNTMDNMKSWVADTLVAYQSDNVVARGADSLTAQWKRQRAKYSSTSDSINAVMSVHSTDKNENWVLVWATAYDTKLDGTKDTTAVMETWRINKDGKADLLYQYDRHARKM